MPKDKHSLASETGKNASETESKKKVVVVEEVEVEETPVETQETAKEESVKQQENVEVKEVAAVKEQVEVTDEDEDEKPNYLWIIVPTALLVGALVGGLITYFSGISNMDGSSATPTPVVTQMPTVNGDEVVPTASPSSTLKRDALKVQVLNGSGVSGVAGKVKAALEKLGYKGVAAGNASSSDFETTEVAIKEDKKEYLDIVIEDLSDDYEAKEAEKALSASSAYDVVITIGKK